MASDTNGRGHQPAPTLVAFYSPRAQSGKSTSAAIFEEAGYVRVKFAEPLKDMTRALFRHFGMGPEEIERYVEGDLKGVPIPEIRNAFGKLNSRRIQQTLGTDWGRNLIYPDFWVDVTMTKVRKLMGVGKSVVIDDLRFPNEYRTLLKSGAKLIEVWRASAEPGDPCYEGQLDGYSFDFKIFNNGTLEQLRARAKEIVREL